MGFLLTQSAINVIFNILMFGAGAFWVIRLPVRLPKSVSALIMVISLAIPLSLDHSIGVPPIDLYDTNIFPWLTLSELPTWGLYPISGYLFIYFYDKWKIKGLSIPIYVLAWTLFGTVFEAIAVSFGVFIYKGWALRYSFLIYLIVQLMIVIVFKILMSECNRLKEGN